MSQVGDDGGLRSDPDWIGTPGRLLMMLAVTMVVVLPVTVVMIMFIVVLVVMIVVVLFIGDQLQVLAQNHTHQRHQKNQDPMAEKCLNLQNQTFFHSPLQCGASHPEVQLELFCTH